MEAGRLVRQLKGHSDRITDLSISSDGRWLLAASMDAHLRVYDIPSARLLQVPTSSTTAITLTPTTSMTLVLFGIRLSA